jgi:6-phosphogluconolactonase (cycloisomerase 2 family)
VYPAPTDNRPEPQNQARPHEAILDPTGDFLVFPDLGADLLRVLRVDKKTLAYTDTVRILCSVPEGKRMLTM